jgi:hypothetical protein
MVFVSLCGQASQMQTGASSGIHLVGQLFSIKITSCYFDSAAAAKALFSP